MLVTVVWVNETGDRTVAYSGSKVVGEVEQNKFGTWTWKAAGLVGSSATREMAQGNVVETLNEVS